MWNGGGFGKTSSNLLVSSPHTHHMYFINSPLYASQGPLIPLPSSVRKADPRHPQLSAKRPPPSTGQASAGGMGSERRMGRALSLLLVPSFGSIFSGLVWGRNIWLSLEHKKSQPHTTACDTTYHCVLFWGSVVLRVDVIQNWRGAVVTHQGQCSLTLSSSPSVTSGTKF